jgi:hypothetical protein
MIRIPIRLPPPGARKLSCQQLGPELDQMPVRLGGKVLHSGSVLRWRPVCMEDLQKR